LFNPLTFAGVLAQRHQQATTRKFELVGFCILWPRYAKTTQKVELHFHMLLFLVSPKKLALREKLTVSFRSNTTNG